MLEASRLCKRIGDLRIFSEVTLRLEDHELLAIMGANGAGKTTLLRVLAGATRPSAGVVRFESALLEPSRPDLRARIGYVAHGPFLYPDLNARENLEFFAAAYGVPDRTRRAEEALAFWGLTGSAGRAVKTYSRGMRQRLELARVMLLRPRLLLLDEPMTGLDETGRSRLEEMLELHRRAGGAVVLTSHDVDLSERLGGRRATLRGGRLVFGS